MFGVNIFTKYKMTILNFKELGELGKHFQVLQYKKVYNHEELPNNNKKEILYYSVLTISIFSS